MTHALTIALQTVPLTVASVIILVLVIFIALLLFALGTVMKDRDRWRNAWKGAECEQMTTFMQQNAKPGASSSQETARKIVKLLVAHGMKANDIVNSALVRQWAKDASLAEIVNEGLSSALAQGWIDLGPRGVTTKLTQAGVAAGSQADSGGCK
jgi:hypothetical protein